MREFSDKDKWKRNERRNWSLCESHIWDKSTSARRWVLDMLIHTSPASRQWITMRVSDRRRMHVHKSVPTYLSLLQLIGYFIRSIWSISMKPTVCVVEDIRFAFDDRRWCNLRHSFARSRNVKWPRTWLACLHSGSRRFNDVVNEWPMQYIGRFKKKVKKKEKRRTTKENKKERNLINEMLIAAVRYICYKIFAVHQS